MISELDCGKVALIHAMQDIKHISSQKEPFATSRVASFVAKLSFTGWNVQISDKWIDMPKYCYRSHGIDKKYIS